MYAEIPDKSTLFMSTIVYVEISWCLQQEYLQQKSVFFYLQYTPL
jgi:hypothetical protein